MGNSLTVFLDRDGVINENLPDHVKSWEEFRFISGTLTALRMLTRARCRIFVVTNQAIVNRGRVSHQSIAAIHRHMLAAVRANGGWVHAVRYCPHRPDEQCGCRKPAPGMLNDLAREWQVDLARSYFVGDALTDVAAGHAVGCRTVLVQTGRGNAELARLRQSEIWPDHICADLLDAARLITRQEMNGVGWAPLPAAARPTLEGNLH